MATMTGVAGYGASGVERLRNLNKVSTVNRLGHADHYSRSLLFRFYVGSEIRDMRVVVQHVTIGTTDSELPAISVHKRNKVFAGNIGRQHLEIRELVGYVYRLWARTQIAAGLHRCRRSVV